LDDAKAPYLFTSDDLSKLIEVTTSIRTKISIMGQVGPRLVDPKSKTAYFTGLFRYAEEKCTVEEILKAREKTLASAVFANNVRTQSGRGFAGRGGGPAAGRGGPGRGTSRPTSSASVDTTHSANKSEAIAVMRLMSDDNETLHPTANGFDDVLSALDDMTQTKTKTSKVKKNPKETSPPRANQGLGVIEEGETDSPNSSSYSVPDPKTTNDNSSVEDNHPNDRAMKKSKVVKTVVTKSSSNDSRLVLNKIESSATLVMEAQTRIEGSSATSTVKNDHHEGDISSISSIESGRSRGSRNLKVKSISYAGFASNVTPEKKEIIDSSAFQSIKTITKKYSEAAIKSTSRDSKDEQEVSHEAIASPNGTVAERTRAIANPLQAAKAKKLALAKEQSEKSTVGKVHQTFPFSPPKSPERSPHGSVRDCPKIGKISLIYPYSNSNSASSAVSSTSNTSSNSPKPLGNTIPFKKPVPTTKVTSFISSSRSLQSNSSDNESAGSHKSSQSTNSAINRSSTPRLTSIASMNDIHSVTPSAQPQLPILSNYVPDKTVAGGSGNLNFDLATRCATALKLSKEEFLELPALEPVKVVDGVEKHTYGELVRRNFVKTYGNLIQTELEKYLVEEDFPLAFSKTAVSVFYFKKFQVIYSDFFSLL
jgi:hypothetical protein